MILVSGLEIYKFMKEIFANKVNVMPSVSMSSHAHCEGQYWLQVNIDPSTTWLEWMFLFFPFFPCSTTFIYLKPRHNNTDNNSHNAIYDLWFIYIYTIKWK